MALHSRPLYVIAMKWIQLLSLMSIISCSTKTELKLTLPEPVTNQASALLLKNGKPVVYTFYGLDSTRQQPGVHAKVFKVDLTSGEAAVLPSVPDEMGRLAASASVIKNKAYIAGGYAVLPGGKEKSSNQLFVFDPDGESFTKASDLPVPIDDQIQSVWRDSLLFIISGWSDSLNVNTVQVYNPTTNTWKLGTPLPNESDAAVFGGSGVVAGDDIYFLGGAIFAKNYPPSKGFYKGVINPLDPSQIQWQKLGEYPGEHRYRSAAVFHDKRIYFFGGSNETYNYNGISYAEKKPVEPNKTVLIYDLESKLFSTFDVTENVQLMDLRNASIYQDELYVAGGMRTHQQVSKQIVKFTFPLK